MAAAAAGVAVALSGTALSAPASAYQPSAGHVNAINNRSAEIFFNDNAVYFQYFAAVAGDPDGLPGPDGTPDGVGAFQYYSGSFGEGAIYAKAQFGTITAYGIYGAILQSWKANGFENGKGYAISPERNAGSTDVAAGCRSGDRVQLFRRYSELTGARRACWNGATGVTWTGLA